MMLSEINVINNVLIFLIFMIFKETFIVDVAVTRLTDGVHTTYMVV